MLTLLSVRCHVVSALCCSVLSLSCVVITALRRLLCSGKAFYQLSLFTSPGLYIRLLGTRQYSRSPKRGTINTPFTALYTLPQL